MAGSCTLGKEAVPEGGSSVLIGYGVVLVRGEGIP
jgi:hypothetical protein